MRPTRREWAGGQPGDEGSTCLRSCVSKGRNVLGTYPGRGASARVRKGRSSVYAPGKRNLGRRRRVQGWVLRSRPGLSQDRNRADRDPQRAWSPLHAARLRLWREPRSYRSRRAATRPKGSTLRKRDAEVTASHSARRYRPDRHIQAAECRWRSLSFLVFDGRGHQLLDDVGSLERLAPCPGWAWAREEACIA